MNAMETFWSTTTAVVISVALGYILGGMGKVTKKECESKHKMEEMVVAQIKSGIDDIKSSLKEMRNEITVFQREARAEDKILHDRITDSIKERKIE